MKKIKKFKISAVVCAKNEENRIINCLKSLKKNKVDEIILVDGNSNDLTVSLSKKFVNKIIISKKKSLTADRQIGINATKNNLVAMIDADHILYKNSIKKLVNDLYNFKLDMVQSQLISKKKNNFLNIAEQEVWDLTHNIPGVKKMIGTAPCIYKKKIFKFVKFDDKITKKIDDTDFMYRLFKLKKFRFGIGNTKIIQDHNANLSDYIKKFLWYGHGDGEFVKKNPERFFSILYHQLVRYCLIYPIKAIFKLKLKSIIFFVLIGLLRFIGMLKYLFKNFIINKSNYD